MKYQDFEKYAQEKLMNGSIADNYKEVFLK